MALRRQSENFHVLFEQILKTLVINMMSNMDPKRVTNLTKSVLNGCSEARRRFFLMKTKLL